MCNLSGSLFDFAANFGDGEAIAGTFGGAEFAVTMDIVRAETMLVHEVKKERVEGVKLGGRRAGRLLAPLGI